jgi:glycosyltransferase involved in cell wall biosynthesis
MLAIVIPYFKLTFFEETLNSLSNQTDKRFMVYIGDDASPENPLILLENYKGKFESIYHRFETNLGGKFLPKQWHRCLDLTANEKWIMMLCDDDVLSENCISEFYKNLEEINHNNINVIRFATDLIDEKGKEFNKIINHPKIEKATSFFIRRQGGGTRNSLSENIFKKDIVLRIKFRNFPLAWHSDDLALLEFSNFGNLFTINDAVVYFRLSEINITNKKNNILEKSEASFQFFYYLLFEHRNKFTLQQNKIIQKKLENNILQNKRKIKNWISIFYLYFIHLNFDDFFNLLSKVPKSIKQK